ncbi:MAG: hypothetical protein AAGA15_03325 [Pseudomonadota bacterium]
MGFRNNIIKKQGMFASSTPVRPIVLSLGGCNVSEPMLTGKVSWLGFKETV